MSKNCLNYEYDGKKCELTASGSIVIAKGKEISFDLWEMGAIYGYGFTNEQYYPWNQTQICNERFEVNNTQSPIWLLEQGFVIFAGTSESLSVTLNRAELRLCCNTADVTIRIYADENLTLAQKQFLDSLEGFRRRVSGII